MSRKICVVFVLFFLSIFAASTIVVKAESQIELTPTSGEPGDSIMVEGSDFAASKAVGIGLGAEVVVKDESVTVTDDTGTGIRIVSGFTAKHPIKPGSFRWELDQGGVLLYYYDYGNGTLGTTSGLVHLAAIINYTTGFFSRSSSTVIGDIMGTEVNYTTYDAGVLSSELRTDGSGVLSGNFTVPDDVWNGTEPLTVIDEAGNRVTADFTTYGSDTIPEPFTVGALILLTSTAIVVSFYWLKKKPTNKIAKYG